MTRSLINEFRKFLRGVSFKQTAKRFEILLIGNLVERTKKEIDQILQDKAAISNRYKNQEPKCVSNILQTCSFKSLVKFDFLHDWAQRALLNPHNILLIMLSNRFNNTTLQQVIFRLLFIPQVPRWLGSPPTLHTNCSKPLDTSQLCRNMPSVSAKAHF